MADDALTWRGIGKSARALASRFSRDRFLKTVFTGCIKVGKSKGNPIRGNLVAAGLREAANHVMHGLSPDEEVRACVWFVQALDTDTVTRKQRASYIIKAGLTDAFVKDVLKIDVKRYAADLNDMINGLNRATHVRPKTVLTDGLKIRRMFRNVLDGIDALLDAAEESRAAVEDAVGTAMHTAVFEKLIAEAIQELDELSTHTAIDHHLLDEINVEEMDAETISYLVTGSVVVDLQYGSGSDVASGMGTRTNDEYPYEAKVNCAIINPLAVEAGDIELKVDTSSFYE